MKTALTNEVILNICLWKSNSGDQEAGPLPQASSCFCPSVQRSKDQRRLALLWDQRQRSELSRTSSPSMQCTRQSSFSTRSAGYCQTSPWTALGTYWITTALCACLLQGSRPSWLRVPLKPPASLCEKKPALLQGVPQGQQQLYGTRYWCFPLYCRSVWTPHSPGLWQQAPVRPATLQPPCWAPTGLICSLSCLDCSGCPLQAVVSGARAWHSGLFLIRLKALQCHLLIPASFFLSWWIK